MLAAVSASDAVMLGLLSQDIMAAISLAGQVQFVFSLYLATMTIGASMFAAQYWGKGDRESVERIFGMVMRFTVPVSAGFTLLTALLPRAVMRIFTPDAELIAQGAVYLRAVSPSYLLCSVIMGHLGSDAVAANSIAGIAKGLLICLCIGIGSGGGILVGNELGAGNLERAKEYDRRVARLSALAGFFTGVVLLLLSPLIVRLTSLTPAAQEYLKWMLAICSYYCIGKSVNSTVIGGIFCAGGDSRFGFLCDAVTLWAITIPLGLLAGFVWKLPVIAVYFILNLDEIIKLPAVYLHFRKYKWVRDLTQEGGTAK